MLNISAYFNEENMFELGNPARVLNTTWARVPLANNETIDEAYIRDNGKCQNTGVCYRQMAHKSSSLTKLSS